MMNVKNVSGEVKVLLVGANKIRFGVNETKTLDPATGQFLVNEFAGVLIQDELIVEVDKLLISEPMIGEGQTILQEVPLLVKVVTEKAKPKPRARKKAGE